MDMGWGVRSDACLIGGSVAGHGSCLDVHELIACSLLAVPRVALLCARTTGLDIAERDWRISD
jgi:hypothetical protein